MQTFFSLLGPQGTWPLLTLGIKSHLEGMIYGRPSSGDWWLAASPFGVCYKTLANQEANILQK